MYPDELTKPNFLPQNVSFNKQPFHLFILYLTFSHSLGESLYDIHSLNRLYFIFSQFDGCVPSLSLTALFFKWRASFTFLYNLLYAQTPIYLFTHRNLETESASLNFNLLNSDKKLSTASDRYFLYRESYYSYSTSFLMTKLSYKSVLTAFVMDSSFFRKTVFFLTSVNIYSIGLLPYSFSPWSLHYPILVSSTNIITQYFFLKYVILLYRDSKSHYYASLKI